MSYTREQRAANAANAAARAAEQAAASAPSTPAQTTEPVSDALPQAHGPQLRNEPRDRAFEEMEAKYAERSGLKQETEEPAAKTEPEAPETAEPAKAAVGVESGTAPLGSPQDASVPAAPSVEMLTVKVDGEEFQVPKAEVEDAGGLRPYQTMRALENRIKKVNETQATNRQREEQLNRALQAIQQPPPPPEPTDDELIQAIRFGTPQEASAALAKVAAKGRGQQVNPQEIVMQSTAMANFNSAKRRFATEFADVTGNPIIATAATAMENQRVQGFVQNGQVNWSHLANVDFDDFFRRIGNEVRGAFGPRQSQPPSAPAGAAPTAGTPSQPSEKEARKASIVNLPTAAARAELPAEDKPDSREDILNDMRKARGKPTG